MGLHVQGNDGYVDSRGFLKPHYVAASSPRNQVVPRRIEGTKMNVKEHPTGKESENCWVCEGWNEIEFEVDLRGVKEDVGDDMS